MLVSLLLLLPVVALVSGRPHPFRTSALTSTSAGNVIVQMFQWSWDSVATECTDFLGPAGYASVQGSFFPLTESYLLFHFQAQSEYTSPSLPSPRTRGRLPMVHRLPTRLVQLNLETRYPSPVCLDDRDLPRRRSQSHRRRHLQPHVCPRLRYRERRYQFHALLVPTRPVQLNSIPLLRSGTE